MRVAREVACKFAGFDSQCMACLRSHFGFYETLYYKMLNGRRHGSSQTLHEVREEGDVYGVGSLYIAAVQKCSVIHKASSPN